MTHTIMLCDDDPKFAQECVDKIERMTAIKKTFKAEVMFEKPDDLSKDVAKLAARQAAFRKGKPWKEEEISFDKASVLIVDFNLISPREVITGELVAYLARCFSNCGLIVGLNLDRKNRFDLTLRGHPESFCDVNINEIQLDNPGLWDDDIKGFRPWAWPVLPKFLDQFQLKVEEAKASLSTGISAFLGFTDSRVHLPKSVSGFLGRHPRDMTLREFTFQSGVGFQGRDKPEGEGQAERDELVIARVVAARISKWLERLILPAQDILVDAPHLISRFPSLLEGDVDDIKFWDLTAHFKEPKKLGINHELIEDFVFRKANWLSRPAWFWSELSDYQEIKEVKDPWERTDVDWFFCEDASRFHLSADCNPFTAQLESPYILRYVRMEDDLVNYEPHVRLLT